jgi:molecular chaperone HscB
MDYFGAFGLEPRLGLDINDLQARFYRLSREHHPDRFTRRPAEEQARALEMTSLLNDGLRVLRDPVQRAEYVLKRAGFDIGEQRTKDVPPELLEEVFELNLALEEMRSGDASARPALADAHRNFTGRVHQLDQQLSGLFADYDAATDGGREVLPKIRGLLNKRRYLENLVREVEKALA